MTGASPVTAAPVVVALRQALPGDRVITDPDALAAVSHDEAARSPASTGSAS